MPAFAQNWTAEILPRPPLIAPAKHVVWPMRIAGEEDAMARGALHLLIRPAATAQFLATCALGFRDPSMPTGVFACPSPDELCAVAGGYAYIANIATPDHCTQVELKPVTAVASAVEAGLLLFVGFHTIQAWKRDGLAWETRRLSWDGIKVTTVESDTARGFGWDLRSDAEVEFILDLATGEHTGGGFRS